MNSGESKKTRIKVVITKSKIQPVFRIDGKSEPIMIVKRGEEEISVRIGDTVKIGPGIYRIVEYIPHKEWKNEITGTSFNASVKCKLIGGRIFYDLRRVSYYDRDTGETFIELTPETLSYFVISLQEKAELMERKRQKLIERLKKLNGQEQ